MKPNICTIVGNEPYLLKFLALRESLETYCRPYSLFILVLDQCSEKTLSKLANIEVVNLSKIETNQAKSRKDKLPANDYVWLLKTFWIRYLLEEVGLPHLLYLDADSLFFASPEGLYQQLSRTDLAITPHRFSPRFKQYERNGLYNAGFIWMRRSKKTLACVKEWTATALAHKYGHLTEQKCLDDWPKKYGAQTIEHLGANLAPWNQGRYTYSRRSREIFVEDDKLIWYHFHQGLETYYPLHPFVKKHIYSWYCRALARAEQQKCLLPCTGEDVKK